MFVRPILRHVHDVTDRWVRPSPKSVGGLLLGFRTALRETLRTGQKQSPVCYAKRAAERHQERSHAERRNEGFSSRIG